MNAAYGMPQAATSTVQLKPQPMIAVTKTNYLIGDPYQIGDVWFDMYGEYKNGEYFLDGVALHGTMFNITELVIDEFKNMQTYLDDVSEESKRGIQS